MAARTHGARASMRATRAGGRERDRARKADAGPGTCRVCGCTEARACVNSNTGETCAWTDRSRTRCTFCTPLRGAV